MSVRPTRRPGELVFAALLVIFSLAAAWQAWRISGFSSISGPGVFPMIATATMLISGLFILAGAARKKPEAERGSAASFLSDVTPATLLIFGAMIVVYMLMLEQAGFVVSSFLFLFASFAWLWRGRILLSLVIAAGSLAAVYVVFRHVFSVVLPAGSLF